MTLSPDEKAKYSRDGYLVLERLFTADEVGRLLAQLEDLVLQRRPRPAGVHFQVEPIVAQGQTAAQSALDALRKVEGLVPNDTVFHEFAVAPKLLDRIEDLVGPDIKLFRDALMMKPARHGSEKPYHQDSPYWPIDPPDLVSCWVALDDATEANGCMRVIPGSHRWGPQPHRMIRDYQVDETTLDLSQEVSVPLKAGGCLLFHSLLLHATAPNTSDQPRRAMIVSYMSARSRHTGSDSQPPYLLLRGREHAGAV